MELYIGGFAQGKTTYVMEKYKGCRLLFLQEGMYDAPDKTEALEDVIVLQHFHLAVRGLLEGREVSAQATDEVYVQTWLEKLLAEIAKLERQGKKVLVISDEVGNGVVPMEAFERVYRECVGRCLIRLATEAEKVERILCGMGQQIK